MSNWLTRATGGISREAADVPQTFELTCECSERHTGQRKGRSQRIICHTCGSALFVLPKNVYPPLKEKAPPKAKQPPKRRRSAGSQTSGLPSVNQLAATVRRGMKEAAGGVGRRAKAGGRKVRAGVASTGRSTVAAARQFFTPFRLVLAGMAVMLLITAVTAVRARQREAARETLRTELAAGQAALLENELTAARDHFAAASAAVDLLGADDPQSQFVRQSHRELTAVTRLAPESLFDMLEAAEKSQERMAAVPWQNLFQARYEGTWFVLQSPVRREQSAFVLQLPLTVGAANRPVRVLVNAPGLDRLVPPESSAVVLFAAPIVGCALDEARTEWTVTFDPQAAFLWSNFEHLRPLGLLSTDEGEEAAAEAAEIEALLARQQEALGAGP